MTKRNDKVRTAIDLIVDCQRQSSDWMPLSDWTDLVSDALKISSKWGANIMLNNRMVGRLLSYHNSFSKYYKSEYQFSREIKIPMYMIVKEENHLSYDYFRATKYIENLLNIQRYQDQKIFEDMQYLKKHLDIQRHIHMNIIMTTPKISDIKGGGMPYINQERTI